MPLVTRGRYLPEPSHMANGQRSTGPLTTAVLIVP